MQSSMTKPQKGWSGVVNRNPFARYPMAVSIVKEITMDENNNQAQGQQENSEPSTVDTPENNTPGEFDINKYRQNLTVQETPEKELEYQSLIKDQNDLINSYRKEIAELKAANLKLASTTTPSNIPETADDIFKEMLK